MDGTAPVALFAWRRPGHLSRTLNALVENEVAVDTDLHIFVDGPRSQDDVPRINEVIRVAERAEGFRSLCLEISRKNHGLSRSLTAGITKILEADDQVIVLEDDIKVGRCFLDFMNDALRLYAEDNCVASIHGHVYPHAGELPDTFFIRGTDCWGWGTWRRAWQVFEPDGVRLLHQLRERDMIRVLDFEGTAPFEEMLIDQIEGRNDSWAVRWYASTLLNDMLTLYPNRPMALNIGEDGSGTHRGSSSAYQQQLSHGAVRVERIPIVESQEGREAFRQFFRSRHQIPSSMFGRWVWRRARRLRNRLRH